MREEARVRLERSPSHAGDHPSKPVRGDGCHPLRDRVYEPAAAAELDKARAAAPDGVIGFNIMDSAVFLLLASLGYIDGGVAPIVGDRGFDPLYINPIPSGLVLTGIVVSVSITAFSLALIQRIYRRYGTIELWELLERAGKEDD